jgi:DMSO/TMAO reductase YedYZ molybdopterin-dependent catalytic subunit
MDERTSETATDRPRTLQRRRFLLAAALAGASGFAGCNTSNDGTAGTSTTGETATTGTEEQTTTETTDTTTAERTTEPELEPPGEKRPLAEKYPGLRILDRWRAGEADSRDVYTQYLTPLDSFYVVSHFRTPVIDDDEHTVSITGGDGTTVEVDMAAIQIDHSTETVTHTMQCAGNGRKYFAEMDGWTFDYGAAGTAQWTGAPVSEVFEAHDVTVADDAWVMAAGADGRANDAERVFARSIPASKLLDDCFLVYRMNGKPLPLEHGFPVRLLVPGWYGTNSVKWLSELRVMDGMVRGDRWREYSEWQQHHYRIVPEGVEANTHATIDMLDTWEQIEAKAAGEVEHYPYVYDMTVKSLIGYPGEDATVSPREADGTVEVLGVAWAGDDRVERVEVSTNGGETWERARFLGPDRGPAAWRQFRYLWDAAPGEYTLYSRATDEAGRTQPREVAAPGSGLDAIRNDEYPWNRGGYASNAYRDLGINVRVE